MQDLETRLTADLADAARTADLHIPDREAVATGVARRRHRRRVRTTALAVAATVLVAAAAVATVGALREDDGSTVIDQPPTPSTMTVPTTPTVPGLPGPVVTASTIVTYPIDPSATTTTTSTTAAGLLPPVSTSLVLRPDGLGPFDFGARQADVEAAVIDELGEPRARYSGDGDQGCAAAAEQVDWFGLVLTFEGPDAGSRRLTEWSAAGSSNPQQHRNFRMENGPKLGDPLAVWQTAYGASFQIEPGGPGRYRAVTITVNGTEIMGFADPDELQRVSTLWRMTTDCVMGG